MNFNKKSLVALLVALSFNAAASTEESEKQGNITAHEEFRGSAGSLVSGQENWYRELRVDSWIEVGVSKEQIESVLALISGTETLRDQSNSDSPKSWTYEFSKKAQSLYEQAQVVETSVQTELEKSQAATLYQQASTMWLIASYPNLMSDHEVAALNRSVDSYVKAAQLRGETVEKVAIPYLKKDGTTTDLVGLLHLPTVATNAPAVLWTGGVDKTLVEHYKSLSAAVAQGYAVLTFDMPGAGLNQGTVLELGREASIHKAALTFIKGDTRIDSTRIGALSSSGSGVALMEFSIQKPELKAVVARCAVVDGLLTKPFLFPKLPLMTAQSFGTRIGADINDLSSFGKLTVPLSLKTKGYFDGKPRMDTPLLVINTAGDSVASPEDMKKTAALSSQGIVEFYGEDGHCPEGPEAEESIIKFLTSNI